MGAAGRCGSGVPASHGSDPWAFEQARSHNDVNEIDTDNDHTTTGDAISNWIDPKYDAAGNMSLAPRPGDEGTANQALLLVYDPWNRPVKVYRDSDADGVLDIPGDALVAAYTYDGLNRRVRKIVAGDPDVTYDYYYNTSWQVMEVRKTGNTHPFEQYAWSGRYVDAPVVRWQDADDDGDLSDTDETLYYLTDANMNVTCLADTAGTPRERYAYEPYGQVAFFAGDWSGRSSSAYANDILYGGYRFDSETGLYHVRNRYYHPTLGRWGQRDPTGYADGISIYAYLRGDPCGATDPTGFSRFWTLGEECLYTGTDYHLKPSTARPSVWTVMWRKIQWNVRVWTCRCMAHCCDYDLTLRGWKRDETHQWDEWHDLWTESEFSTFQDKLTRLGVDAEQMDDLRAVQVADNIAPMPKPAGPMPRPGGGGGDNVDNLMRRSAEQAADAARAAGKVPYETIEAVMKASQDSVEEAKARMAELAAAESTRRGKPVSIEDLHAEYLKTKETQLDAKCKSTCASLKGKKP